MCGRINLTSAPHVLAERFYLDVEPDLEPRWNIAPGQEITAVITGAEGSRRQARSFAWGLVPAWSRAPDQGPRPINARSETVREKRTFRDAIARRRCLVPVNGFYEWRRRGGTSLPFLFRRPEHDLFALAGIWERWTSPDGGELDTCAILTTRANGLMAPVHDRMPVIVVEDRWRDWYDLPVDKLDPRTPLLQPVSDDFLVAHRVDRRVGNPAWDDPGCVEPVAGDDGDQMDLFG
jgi:putative SOS response-associated peptidase YedK